jgi:nucleotide-binding universal stress UspA family protein
MAQPVLIAHDGSPASAAAIKVAGDLLGPRPAVVVNVWGPILAAAPAGALPANLPELDSQLAEAAEKAAQEGARLASDAGFEAEPRTASQTPAWLGIVSLAEELDAAAIVVGARGLSGFKSALLGSTSNGVVHHTKRPVIVIPSTEERSS